MSVVNTNHWTGNYSEEWQFSTGRVELSVEITENRVEGEEGYRIVSAISDSISGHSELEEVALPKSEIEEGFFDSFTHIVDVVVKKLLIEFYTTYDIPSEEVEKVESQFDETF